MDFIYVRIKRDILEFYDKWYIGNVKCMKALHVQLLDEYYEPGQFNGLNGKALREAKVEFLSKLQNVVDMLWDCRS